MAEVVPAPEKGGADYSVTGTMPAYNGKWCQVMAHNVRARLGFTATFTGINLDDWDSMNAATQSLIPGESGTFEDGIWAVAQAGMDCNAQGPCDRSARPSDPNRAQRG